MATCHTCSGSGVVTGICDVCGGSGQASKSPCFHCGGRGDLEDRQGRQYECIKCGGDGFLVEECTCSGGSVDRACGDCSGGGSRSAWADSDYGDLGSAWNGIPGSGGSGAGRSAVSAEDLRQQVVHGSSGQITVLANSGARPDPSVWFTDSSTQLVTRYRDLITAAAARHGVDADLLRAVVWMESTQYSQAPGTLTGDCTLNGWATDLGLPPDYLRRPDVVIESTAWVLSELGNRVPAGRPEQVASAFRDPGAGRVNDYGAGVAFFWQHRPWLRVTDLPQRDVWGAQESGPTSVASPVSGTAREQEGRRWGGASQGTGPASTTTAQATMEPLEILHAALDVAGLVPALGAIPDGVNAGLYLIEGDWAGAGLSAAAMIPVLGEGATLAKLGSRTVVRVSGEAVERVGREGVEASLREARATQVPRDIDEAVERGIVEEITTTTRTPQVRLSPPLTTGNAEAARDVFDSKLRDGYAQRLHVPSGGDVHHAIELRVLDRYPGAFSPSELNDFANMRGIPVETVKVPSGYPSKQLHNSKIAEMWKRHYVALDREIASRGLRPGTDDYNRYVRDYLKSARDEVDHVLGQFFTEKRARFKWRRLRGR